MFGAIQSVDSAILLWIQNNLRSDVLDPIVIQFTKLGDGGKLFIAMTLVALLFAKTRKAGVASAIAMILGLILVSFVLKPIVMRPRPFMIVEGLNNLVTLPEDPYSFPSGHSCTAFALACSWSAILKKRWVSVSVYLLAFLMAFSRLYVAVHNPSDVIVGILCGMLCAMIGVRIIRIWENRQKPLMEREK